MPSQKNIERKSAKEVLPKVAETIVEKAVSITVTIKAKNKIHAFLLKHKIVKQKIIFDIKPQRVINVYRISGRAVNFDTGRLFKSTDNIGNLMDVMSRHGEDIFYIVACAVQNNHLEPSKKLISLVKNEFEMEDIAEVLKSTISNYNISAFLTTITLIVGVYALTHSDEKVSPQVKGS